MKGKQAWNKGLKTGMVPRTAFRPGFTPWNKGTGKVPAVNRKMRSAISIAVKRSIRGGSFSRGISNFVGWSIEDLRAHMELLFKPGMTWETYGTTWTIDHICPVSSFDIQEKGDGAFRRCWALSNLQPLSRVDNSRKGTRDALCLLDYAQSINR